MTPTNRKELIVVLARKLAREEWNDNPELHDCHYDLDHFCGSYQEKFARRSGVLLDAIEAAGCRVAPLEATQKMIDAGSAELDPTWGYSSEAVGLEWAEAAHLAMLAASPFSREG